MSAVDYSRQVFCHFVFPVMSFEFMSACSSLCFSSTLSSILSSIIGHSRLVSDQSLHYQDLSVALQKLSLVYRDTLN